MDVNQIHLTRQDNITRQWFVVMNGIGTGITRLASMFNDNKPCYPFSIAGGSFNYCIAVEFEDCQEDRTRWMIRLPIPGRVMDPEKKIKHEAATMRYLYEKTSIPVPKVIACGTTEDNCFFGVGPFIIMEYVEGKPLNEVLMGKPLDELFRPRTGAEQIQEMADRAEAARQQEEGPLLSPDITDETLTTIYRQVANIYLELAEHKFDKIGSLSTEKTRRGTSWEVEHPPHTLDDNEQQRNRGVPADNETEPFKSAVAYLSHLAALKFKQLTCQRNSVEDAADGREKYASRLLLHSLIPRFTSPAHVTGPFHLVCDDLNPQNILVNPSLEIVAVLDWEWSYAGPYELFSTPPSWLILRDPDEWTDTYRFDEPGPDDLLKLYESKLGLFLKAMREEEAKRWTLKRWDPIVRDFAFEKHQEQDQRKVVKASKSSRSATVSLTPSVPVVYYDVLTAPLDTLSGRMAASMTSGQFWLSRILQRGSFERLFWQRLDELCFGPRHSTEKRIDDWAVSKEDTREMERWVGKKLKDLTNYRIEVGPEESDEEGLQVEDGWHLE